MGMSRNLPYRLCCDKSRNGGTPPHACFVATLQKMGIERRVFIMSRKKKRNGKKKEI